MDFTPQPGITYTINSPHALEFNIDPLSTQCGQLQGAACFSDPLGYYVYPWPTSIPSYTGTASLSEANVVNEPCSARGNCTAQNIPSQAKISGVEVDAPRYWYLAYTSQPWQINCNDVTNGAVTVQASGANICATFTPNYGLSLAQAEQICGVQNFDWVQVHTIKFDPSYLYARNLLSAFDSSILGPVQLTSQRTPWNDPPLGGGYTYTSVPDYSYPFYYDPTGELATHESGATPDACTLPVSQAG